MPDWSFGSVNKTQRLQVCQSPARCVAWHRETRESKTQKKGTLMSKESRIMNDFPPVSLISPLRQGAVVRAQIQRRCEQVIAV